MTDKKLLARALGFTNNLRGVVNQSTDGAYAMMDLSTARGLIEVLDLMRAEVAALGGERAKVLDLNRQLHEAVNERATWQGRWEVTDKALGDTLAAVNVLEAQVYPAGAWHCPECKFTLQQMVMDASTGNVAPMDKDGGNCPNCDTALARKTWRQEAEEMLDRAMELHARIPSEPVAVAYDFDGHGWRYIDAGSGSDWLERGQAHADHVLLYALPDDTPEKPQKPH